jgi:hypothetical protein
MRQNAQQIMDIVRGAFPKESFDGSSRESMCTQPQGDGELLSCLWINATSLSSSDQKDTIQTLDALTEASDMTGSVHSDTNVSCV